MRKAPPAEMNGISRRLRWAVPGERIHEVDKTYKPDLLVTSDFRMTAAILRHYEKERVSTHNRLYALTQFPRKPSWGMHLPETHPDVIWFRSHLAEVKEAEDDKITTLTSMYAASPLARWTSQFKGLAPGKLTARFLGEIGDPYLQVTGHDKQGNVITEPRVRTLAQLRRLCGMSVEDGKSPGNSRGEQSSFSSHARVRLWLITDQLIKQHDEMFHPLFLAGVEKYQDEKYRGTDAKGKPWSDERFAVIGRKRARVLVGVAFLEGLYHEAKRLHEES
jgi:hypothetical protein